MSRFYVNNFAPYPIDKSELNYLFYMYIVIFIRTQCIFTAFDILQIILTLPFIILVKPRMFIPG